MRKTALRWIIWGMLLSLLPLSPALAFHEHVDIDGADTLVSGFRSPTETEAGYTGDEVCSVCGAVISQGSRIPSLREQRGESSTPAPTRVPDPTAAPTQVPTAVPTPVPTPVPTQVSNTAVSHESGAGGEASTPVPPTAVPPAEITPTALPPRVEESSSTSSARATAQPDLSQDPAVQSQAASAGRGGAGSGASSSSDSFSRSGSSRGSSSSAGDRVRDLARYPLFSARFPWRRLRMAPEEDILLTLAGEPVWPLDDPSSPLMMLMIP